MTGLELMGELYSRVLEGGVEGEKEDFEKDLADCLRLRLFQTKLAEHNPLDHMHQEDSRKLNKK
jgi:hypothetical protein